MNNLAKAVSIVCGVGFIASGSCRISFYWP